MLVSYDTALARIHSALEPLDPVIQSIDQCQGKVLSDDLVAPIDIPPFDNSAMDGYAVRAADTHGASGESPVQLAVIGEIAPGIHDNSISVGREQAARIFTGGVIPAGADAIVPIEDTAGSVQGSVAVTTPAEPNAYLRRAGGDMRRGDIALRAGTQMRAYEIAQAASLGSSELSVHRSPRVALIATGNELVEPQPGIRLENGQIYNSNVYALQALVEESGGETVARLHALDTPESIRAILHAAADTNPDIIISSGGVSVGDYDYVKAAVEEDGRGEIDFWRVAIRPGKPFVFGRYGTALFFGLPGNPVSTIVTYELFVRPALRRLAGHAPEQCARPLHWCILTAPARHEPGRRSFQRAVASINQDGQLTACPVAKQGSHMIGGLVQANSLLVVPDSVSELPEGGRAQVMLLGNAI